MRLSFDALSFHLIFTTLSPRIAPMKLTLNGQPHNFSNSTLAELIQTASKNPEHVIAEVNGAIIKKNNWNQMLIKEGDAIELVTFVGGG